MSRRPDGERNDVLDKVRAYLSEPRSMVQLTKWLDVDRRTVYRYFKDIQATDEVTVQISLDRPARYTINLK